MKTFDINQPHTHNPFKVPEGYFDHLTSRIMEQIPETGDNTSHTVELQPKRNWLKLGWGIAAAACITLAVVFVQHNHLFESSTQQGVTANNNDDTSVDEQFEQEMLDYAMVDNSDIYNYLANNY